jgi:hypothetical protein
MKFIIGILCLSSLLSQGVWAQSSPADQQSAFVYPELQVSPRASERINMEAKTEVRTRRTQLLPMQISALSTLLAAAGAPNPTDEHKKDRDDVKYSRQVAMGVGVSWLVFSYFFNEDYVPYTRAAALLKTMPDKTPQEELVRERIAEEQIEAASSLGKKMMWASVVTNLAAAGYLGSNTQKEGEVYAGVAAILAFTPIVFKDRWQTVNGYHQEYKKRIYGPITLPTLMSPLTVQASNSSPVPGVIWHLSF